MKEIKRFKLVATESAKNVIECDDGHWVHYSNVEQLQARIKELESDTHINEIKAQGIEEAITKADGETYIYPVGTEALKQQYRAELKCYAETLRTKHD